MTNALSEPGLPYFRGKGLAEGLLQRLKVSYAIIRPTLIFGVGDLLLNNMAWALRRFPVFPVYGNGDYPVQPVYVEDLATQAAAAGSESENSIADAAGPETFSFETLLHLLASAINVRRRFVHTPPFAGLALTGLVGLLMRDVALTRDELDGLMAGLLISNEPPTGTTRLFDWLSTTRTAWDAGTCPSYGVTTASSRRRDEPRQSRIIASLIFAERSGVWTARAFAGGPNRGASPAGRRRVS